MTITAILEECAKLVFAQVATVHRSEEAPWVIAHILDVDTMRACVPQEPIFMNTRTLHTGYQMHRIGPFFTPAQLNLRQYGLPEEGHIIVGQKGRNAKGVVFTSWLPDRWARPMGYFVHYLSNGAQATRLYQSPEPTLRMVLLNRLRVEYGTISDERLYDLLLLILFDDMTGLLAMCRKLTHRPSHGRTWDLTSVVQIRRMTLFCSKFIENPVLTVPSVSQFVEEVAYLIQDSTICGHFRAVLAAQVDEDRTAFQKMTLKWLKDEECLNATLMQNMIDHVS